MLNENRDETQLYIPATIRNRMFLGSISLFPLYNTNAGGRRPVFAYKRILRWCNKQTAGHNIFDFRFP